MYVLYVYTQMHTLYIYRCIVTVNVGMFVVAHTIDRSGPPQIPVSLTSYREVGCVPDASLQVCGLCYSYPCPWQNKLYTVHAFYCTRLLS